MQPIIPPSVLPAVAFVKTQFMEPQNYVTVGTATLITPRLLLTAGHVVFDHYRHLSNMNGGNPFITQRGEPIRISLTFGNGIEVRAQNWLSNELWVTNHAKNIDIQKRVTSIVDYGAIILANAVSLGPNQIFEVDTLANAGNLAADVGGYSAHHYKMFREKRLFADSAIGLQQFSAGRCTYERDTFPGMSGGPLWTSDNNGRTVRGVHTSEFSGTGPGSALSITNSVLDQIQEWMQDHN